MKTKRLLLNICSFAFMLAVAAFIGMNVTTNVAKADAKPFAMSDTVSIRFVDNDCTGGIRFRAVLSESYLESKLETERDDTTGDLILKNYKDADDCFGMMIVPERYLTDDNFGFNNQVANDDYYDYFKNTLGNVADIRYEYVSNIYKEDGVYYLRGSLVDIYIQNYNLNFVGIAYFFDGSNYEYSAPAGETYFSANVAATANRFLNDYAANFNPTQTDNLKQISAYGRYAEKGVVQSDTGYTYLSQDYGTIAEMLTANGSLDYDVAENQTFEYSTGSEIVGTKYTAYSTASAVNVKENVQFSGDLISLGYCNINNDYKIKNLSVLIKDRANGKVLELAFDINGDMLVFGGIMASWSYDGQSATEDRVALGVNLADNTTGQYAAGASRTITISAGTDDNGIPTILFNNGFWGNAWKKYFEAPYSLNLTGFGSNGVDISIKVNAFNNASSASFMELPKYIKAENQSYTNANLKGSLFGTKYTVFNSSAIMPIKENVPFSGDLLSFGYCNSNGNYDISKFTVMITDRATSNVLSLMFELNNDIRNAGGVKAGWSYNGTTVWEDVILGVNISDSTSGTYSSACPRVLTISVGTNGNSNPSITFNNVFLGNSWKPYFENAKALDLTGFGASGVDISAQVTEIQNGASLSCDFIVTD